MKPFKHAGVGGTFDHFHTGHTHILDTAFQQAQKVTIGISTDALLADKQFKMSIESYLQRKKHVLDYIKNNKLEKRSDIVPLADLYGPAINDKTMDVIVVSKETKHAAVKINRIRKKSGLPKLTIITIPFVKSTDKKIIRSRRIRKGEIDTKGVHYLHLFKKNSLFLPEKLKKELRYPFGKIIKGNNEHIIQTAQKAKYYIAKQTYPMIITVGDVVSVSLSEIGISPGIQIIDKKTQRKEYLHSKKLTITSFSRNMAGKIQKRPVFELNKKIKEYITNGKPSILAIQGEEDLMALPAMLLAPLYSLIIYGQNDVGIIVVVVTEKIKEKVAHLLSQFY